MEPEKQTDLLMEALRKAMVRPGEHRLYKSGKNDGLFPRATGPSAEVAAKAVRDGFLDHVRVEEKGKFLIQWVQITPKGIDLVHDHDSPRAILNELRTMLETSRSGVPAWMDGMIQQMEALAHRFAEQMTNYVQRFDLLQKRVEEAIRRMETSQAHLPEPIQALIPWGRDALKYLDQRKNQNPHSPCPLPELFDAVKVTHPELQLRTFHDGLRRLADHRSLELLPTTDLNHLPQPELALMDGARVLYFVQR